jgi:hypothetical protein
MRSVTNQSSHSHGECYNCRAHALPTSCHCIPDRALCFHSPGAVWPPPDQSAARGARSHADSRTYSNPEKREEGTRALVYFGSGSSVFLFIVSLFSYYDVVLRGCGDRLVAGSSANVDISEQSVSRGEAIKKAKSETGAYVILLTLTFDSMSRSADDLLVEYVVFAPTTSKVVTTGRSYLNSNRAGPLVVGRGSTNSLYLEQMLRQAGEDAGNRILKALHLNVTVTQ